MPRKNTGLTIEACGQTDVGRRRPHNEDSIQVDEQLGLFVVADGMGGHAAGEVASRTAVETLHHFVSQAMENPDFTWPFGVDETRTIPENILLTGARIANRRICQMAEENEGYRGMGTTLAILMTLQNSVLIGHVGDSRIYRLRKGVLEQLTMDHSWVNEQLQRNIITQDEARNHRWRNVITRALGNRQDIEIDLLESSVAPNDLFLICSDGLNGMLTDEQIQEILIERNGKLKQGCRRLIQAANQAGGEDNISVVLVQVQHAPYDPESTQTQTQTHTQTQTQTDQSQAAQ